MLSLTLEAKSISGVNPIQRQSNFDVGCSALLSYCKRQYKDDALLRFRQVDLDSVEVLDAFIDVPTEINLPRGRDEQRRMWTRLVRNIYATNEPESVGRNY